MNVILRAGRKAIAHTRCAVLARHTLVSGRHGDPAPAGIMTLRSTVDVGGP
jgi:hypothetical protein